MKEREPKPRSSPSVLQPGRSLTPGEWLTYYGECQNFLLTVGQKFFNLFVQASVFALAAAAAIVAAAEKLDLFWPANLVLTGATGLGLLVFAVVAVYYFLQVRHAGIVLSAIEKDGLGLTGTGGLLTHLRESRAGFFARNWTLALVIVYLVALGVLVLAVARACDPA